MMVGISETSFRRWNEHVAGLLTQPNHEQVLQLLAESCRELVSADAIFVAVYGKSSRPISLYDDVPERNRFGVIDSYNEGAYLLDPFYRAGIEGVAEGLYHLQEIGPPGFEESEFFRSYYYRSGIADEVGYLTYLPGDYFANYSLVRLGESDNFDPAEIRALDMAQAVVHQTLINYWTETGSDRGAASPELHSQLEVALSQFGNSLLTEREMEVIHLYLKGHNTASITTRLGISHHTVSTHRKSAYHKLDINSQGELFHLFLDSLSCFDPVARRDPLTDYLSVSR